MNERWKKISDFPGYEVSDKGQIRSFWTQVRRPGHRNGFESIRTNKPILIVPWIQKPGNYRMVRLGKKRTGRLVHRLVLLAFKGKPKKGQQCRHLDGNSLNNRLTNLCWGTPKENGADKIRHGTSLRVARGEDSHMAILTEKNVRQIRKEYSKGKRTQKNIARQYGVDCYTIHSIVRFKNWKHVI